MNADEQQQAGAGGPFEGGFGPGGFSGFEGFYD